MAEMRSIGNNPKPVKFRSLFASRCSPFAAPGAHPGKRCNFVQKSAKKCKKVTCPVRQLKNGPILYRFWTGFPKPVPHPPLLQTSTTLVLPVAGGGLDSPSSLSPNFTGQRWTHEYPCPRTMYNRLSTNLICKNRFIQTLPTFFVFGKIW